MLSNPMSSSRNVCAIDAVVVIWQPNFSEALLNDPLKVNPNYSECGSVRQPGRVGQSRFFFHRERITSDSTRDEYYASKNCERRFGISSGSRVSVRLVQGSRCIARGIEHREIRKEIRDVADPADIKNE